MGQSLKRFAYEGSGEGGEDRGGIACGAGIENLQKNLYGLIRLVEAFFVTCLSPDYPNRRIILFKR